MLMAILDIREDCVLGTFNKYAYNKCRHIVEGEPTLEVRDNKIQVMYYDKQEEVVQR